jgi:hypothetical protein
MFNFNVCKLKYFFLILLLSGCKPGRWNPDVSHIKVNAPVHRFEREFFALDTVRLGQSLGQLRQKDSLAFQVYFRYLLGMHLQDSAGFAANVKKLLTDKYWKELYQDEQKIYTDSRVDSLRKEFEEAFRHYKYYFPKDSAPALYTFLQGFNPQGNTAVFTFEGRPGNQPRQLAGISLEMFMGSHYKYYSGLEAYGEYQIKRFRREYILPNVFRALFESKYPEDAFTDPSLLSRMLYAGKRLFFLDLMRPDLADTLKIEYTKDKLKWCFDNESDVWAHFIKEDLLYGTDEKKNMKYLGDAPYTVAENVPQESAPRLGEWLGWQIIKSYMKENPGVTPDQMFSDKDYKKILSLSHYRPKG